ncbi:MAG: glycine zipper family protein [Desulfobulbaceae bacterium]|nr:glycine zipper family protein [Desulfobulbaceae bacterium]
MRSFALSLIVCFGALASGCAAHPKPIIDMKGVDQEQFVDDWNECEAYANEVQMATGVAKGAATGAAVGAIYGAIAGHRKTELTAWGAVDGGTSSGLDAHYQKQEVFKRCMLGRGYRVLN